MVGWVSAALLYIRGVRRTQGSLKGAHLRLTASALWRISRPAGLQVDRLAAARLEFKKVGATTIARG